MKAKFLDHLCYLDTALDIGASREEVGIRLERLLETDIPVLSILEDTGHKEGDDFTTECGGALFFKKVSDRIDLPYNKRRSYFMVFAKYYFMENKDAYELNDRVKELQEDVGIAKEDILNSLLNAYDERNL